MAFLSGACLMRVPSEAHIDKPFPDAGLLSAWMGRNCVPNSVFHATM